MPSVWGLFDMGARSCRLPGHAGRHSARPTACRSPVRGVMRGRIGYREGQSGARGGTRSAANHAAVGRIAWTSDAEGGLLAPGASAGVRPTPKRTDARPPVFSGERRAERRPAARAADHAADALASGMGSGSPRRLAGGLLRNLMGRDATVPRAGSSVRAAF